MTGNYLIAACLFFNSASLFIAVTDPEWVRANRLNRLSMLIGGIGGAVCAALFAVNTTLRAT